MSNLQMLNQDAVTGRWVLKGILQLMSPLIIGGGNALFGDSDIVVLKDELGRPFIPSSSITGALKHAFADYEYTGNDDECFMQNSRWFWGGEYLYQEPDSGNEYKNEQEQENDKTDRTVRSCQSAMIISDLFLEGDNYYPVTIRDGIKVNHKSGTAEEGKKFDFEMVEPGNCFVFKMEIVIRKAFSKSIFKLLLNWVVSRLQSGEFSLGARTSQGFGRCCLKEYKFFEFNFAQKDHVLGWLSGNYEPAVKKEEKFTSPVLLKYKYDLFRIKALFHVSNSIIVGSYPSTAAEPDKVHIQSRKPDGSGEPVAVIPGTSLRGAIRSRAERIANTLGVYNEQEFNILFGWVNDTGDETSGPNAFKSKIMINESLVDGSFNEEIQYRVKIDRFTGGVMNGSLFDSMPVWAKGSLGPFVILDLVIKYYEPWEAGLILLVLKDMWNEDLPVGGEKAVGRGTLKGVRAEISLGDRKITLEQKHNGKLRLYEKESEDWNEATAEELERLVAAFSNSREATFSNSREVGGERHAE